MGLLESIVVFVIAMAIVIKASHWVLDHAIKLAGYFGIAEFATGYVFIASATSFPDFAVAVNAAAKGSGGLALGDVLGSSIANVCLVLGIVAMMKRIDIKREHTLENAELLFIVAILPLLLLYRGALGPTEGMVLLLVFALYALFVVKQRFTTGLRQNLHRESVKALALFALGVAAVMIAANYVVASAVEIASLLHVPEALIGLTIISFGTTLPELMIDFVALRRGQVALAIGDVFGSAVINLTVVLGTAALFGPIANGIALFTTGFIVLAATTFFVWYALMRHEGISRRHGLVLVLAYIVYILVEAIVGLTGITRIA